MTGEIIRAEHIKKHYPIGTVSSKRILRAVDDVSLSIHQGEMFGVVGESGCGKSTLGRCILRLTDVTDGRVFFKGQDISTLNSSQMIPYRKEMQMIFQNPYSSFNPKMAVGKNIREVGTVHKMTPAKTDERIKLLLDYISLSANILDRHPEELSGGQLQRLAIMRALFLNPSFVLADEPVSSLDVSVQAQILNLILDLREELGIAFMFISHDLSVVERVCDRVIVLYLGTIVETAPVSKLFGNKNHPYTKALISAKPKENPSALSSGNILHGDIADVSLKPEGCSFAPRCSECRSGICDKDPPVLREVSQGHFIACHMF
jgi:oligopeptide/dipeptide ABC transporter ATP-binding protein